MKLIFAQGNPGLHYHSTRHNIGWRLIDVYAAKKSTAFSEKNKFNAEVAEFNQDGVKILLVKPTTFYNETGVSARALVDFFKLDPASDVLVIHDELALPFGKLRVRQNGSDAGNNGVKSLNAHLGQHYTRLRVGIWNAQRERSDDRTFVLGKFTAAENQSIEQMIAPAAFSLIDQFLAGNLIDETISLDLSGFEQTNDETNKHHTNK